MFFVQWSREPQACMAPSGHFLCVRNRPLVNDSKKSQGTTWVAVFQARTPLAARTRKIAGSENPTLFSTEKRGEDGLLRRVPGHLTPEGNEEAIVRRIGTPSNGARRGFRQQSWRSRHRERTKNAQIATTERTTPRTSPRAQPGGSTNAGSSSSVRLGGSIRLLFVSNLSVSYCSWNLPPLALPSQLQSMAHIQCSIPWSQLGTQPPPRHCSGSVPSLRRRVGSHLAPRPAPPLAHLG